MGILIKIVEKKTARGKSNNKYSFLNFSQPGIFDIRYRSGLHRRFVLDEIRRLTTKLIYTCDRKRTKAFKIKEAKRWMEAIRRNAPLLDGFFHDEPAWRKKMLVWCEKMLVQSGN